MRHDLLTEPLLSWRGRDRVRHDVTLPGVLAALSAGHVVDFPRARAHQQHPWSMFLTQLAAIAMKRAGIAEPPVDESQWLGMLLSLTENQHEGWCLVVDDLSKPAFFQPPVPEGQLRKPPKTNGTSGKKSPGDEWNRCEAPDDLDILVTSKRHDVKAGLISAGDVEAWTYGLCSLQTMQGRPGRGYTRISRMNGSYGSRPRVGLSASIGFAARFRRDVTILLETWPRLLARGFADRGVALVWLKPWNGANSLSVPELAPHYIEVCWRVRLVQVAATILATYTTTENRRCAPEIKGGDVGDVWTPVARKDGKVLTPGSKGYHYRLLVDLMFGESYEPAAAQALRASDPDSMTLCLSAFVRGQGKTEGLHERMIHLPASARRAFLARETREALGLRAQSRVKCAAEMRSNVLFPALKLLNGPPDSLDARIDERFFDALFSTIQLDDSAAQAAWDDELVELALVELERSIERTALPAARFWRATTAARSMFDGCLKRRFPDAFARLHKTKAASAAVTEVTPS